MNLSVEIPNSFHRRLTELAAANAVSVEHYVALAVAEKLSALDALGYLRQRAERGSEFEFDRFLASAPAVSPELYDQFPGSH